MADLELAPHALLNYPTAVHLLPATAKKLLDACACPVKRDAEGTLHVIVADASAVAVLDNILVGFKAYLAPESRVRALLRELYNLGEPELGDAIDIDLEASRRNAPSPGPPVPIPAPTVQVIVPPAASPQDPLAPRASGSFPKRRPKDEEETMRVQRSPSKPPPAAPVAPGPAPRVAVVDETREEMRLPTVDERVRGAFTRGVLVGAGVTAALAAIVIVALLMR